MINQSALRRLWSDWNIVLLLSGLKLVIHLVTNILGGYGIFRDELYYIACSENLAAGFVDQPPLSIFILAVNRLIFGDSIFALRLLPAVFGAATVFLAGAMSRELGGNRFAQGLACLAAITAPIYLAMNSIYSMNSFEILSWALASYIVIRLLKTESPRYWLSLGLVLGLGMLNKIGIAWFAFGIFFGFLLTPQRSWFKTKWPWISGVMILLLFLPYIAWNVMNDFAALEFIRGATQKYSSQTPVSFLLGQLLILNPFAIPIWLLGIIFLFRGAEKKYRVLAYAYLTALVILIVNVHSKPEYLAPAYVVLFAAGSVSIEELIRNRGWNWVRPVSIAALVISLGLVPLVLPILPVETYITYAERLGFGPTTSEGHRMGKLPQFYADMFGWEDKANAVVKAYLSLSPEDQKKCAVFADNYGRCASIDFFGKENGLPRTIGGHNNYWLWGPRGHRGELVIILGGNLEDKKEIFESVVAADSVHSEYCMPYENDLKIYVCRNLKVSLDQMWPRVKHFE